ncbi:MAG: FMN-binding protein [Flavobacteriaceae bacterium]
MKTYLKLSGAVVVLLLISSFGLPKNISKKVNKEITSAFEITDFTTETISVSQAINTKLPTKINQDNLFKINQSDELVGYFYVGKAPSKTDQFDYLVLFGTQLQVIKAKVLVYREDYGNEIGSKRWLKQFIGKTSDDNLKYGQTIDAISGATISANSMTIAMSSLLKSITILKKEQVL